jgi:NAD(P)H-hydrate repair Nnr-like enzyme with NAD(P)H-hydrate dehydratase domain
MNWLRQAADKPLFEDTLWSRPENRRHAGKLLIVGGHKQSFNTVSEAYTAALEARIGTARVILPDSLQKMLVKLFPTAEYAASTPIGSFSRQALGTLLDAAGWADAVLLAGDFGGNSETQTIIDAFIDKYSGPLAITGDGLDLLAAKSSKFASRPSTLLICELHQLQKLAAPSLIQQKADFMSVIKQISGWVSQTELAVITVHSDKIIVAHRQNVSTTPAKIKVLNQDLAAYAAVWYLQQPEKIFEALTTSIYCLVHGG